MLRARGLKGFKFRRQVPIGPYIVDFLCAEKRLGIEIDGISHDHQLAYDARRDSYLRNMGYRVLRLRNDQILHELAGAMRLVLQALKA